MSRRWIGVTLVALWLGAMAHSRGDDFGDFLKKAAKDKLKNQFSEQNLDRTFKPHELNADVYTIQTADGWTLVAHRYRPMGQPVAQPVAQPKPGMMPVILCHGLSYNAMFWDLDPSCSLAEYLSKQGYDVWSVSLRGCGLSQKWVWKIDSAPTIVLGGAVRRMTGGKLAPTGYATVDPNYANWNMDHHIAYDVPAFIHLVKHHTGAKEVAWVGHSMGGIIALAYLSRFENTGIGKLVTVGSQVTMPDGQLAANFILEMIKTRKGQLAGNLRELDKKQLMADAHTSVNNMFFNERHVSPKVYEALCTWANDTPSINLLQQYMHLSKTGELHDAEKQFNYARHIGNVKVPILISGGEADQLAPPNVQKHLHDHIGSTNKSLVIFGRSHGFTANAGHNDALVGTTSRQQFYPVIERWLRTGRP